MKKLFLITLAILMTSISSQADEVYLSIAMPSKSILDSNTKTILKNKIISMMTSEGIGATDYSAIAMIPEVSVLNEEKIEGGMRTITSLELDITITVRNIITNNIFNSIHISAKGNGYTPNETYRAAIRSIDASLPQYQTFIKETKRRIVDYYRTNTSLLLTKANTMASQQQYDEAIALLATYPEFLNGYTQVATAIKNIFKQGQSKYCGEIMMSARAAYANRDFEGASEILSYIDPTSSCASEAKQLLASIKRSNDNAYSNEIALQKQKIKSAERISLATINAARDVAKAYFKRQATYVYFW